MAKEQICTPAMPESRTSKTRPPQPLPLGACFTL